MSSGEEETPECVMCLLFSPRRVGQVFLRSMEASVVREEEPRLRSVFVESEPYEEVRARQFSLASSVPLPFKAVTL